MKKTDDIALVKKCVVRRKFTSKTGKDRQKAPKIQRIITDARLCRKRSYRVYKLTKHGRISSCFLWSYDHILALTYFTTFYKLLYLYFRLKRRTNGLNLDKPLKISKKSYTANMKLNSKERPQAENNPQLPNDLLNISKLQLYFFILPKLNKL